MLFQFKLSQILHSGKMTRVSTMGCICFDTNHFYVWHYNGMMPSSFKRITTEFCIYVMHEYWSSWLRSMNMPADWLMIVAKLMFDKGRMSLCTWNTFYLLEQWILITGQLDVWVCDCPLLLDDDFTFKVCSFSSVPSMEDVHLEIIKSYTCHYKHLLLMWKGDWWQLTSCWYSCKLSLVDIG